MHLYATMSDSCRQAQNPDELTIVENEPLEITSEGDGDGWVRARNQAGAEGLIPHNYVEVGTTAGGRPTVAHRPRIHEQKNSKV